MLRLSIIVPMYNVASYVEKCIRSLENQDIPHSEYEIICVNDGSPDNCKDIVENLQKEFSNIVLINQNNQGVSMARNNAIDIAKGKYLLMIDPDDYVLPDCFARLLNKIEEEQFDVFYLGFEIFDVQGHSKWATDYRKHESKIYTGVEGYAFTRGPSVKDPDRSWAILYNKELFENKLIRYPKDVPYLEDGLFLAKVATISKRVGFDTSSFYQRTTRIGSATNSNLLFSFKAINGFVNGAILLDEFRNSFDLSETQKHFLNQPICKFVGLAISSCASILTLKYIIFVRLKFYENGLKKLKLDTVYISFRTNGEIYNQSPYLLLLFFFLPLKLRGVFNQFFILPFSKYSK